MGIPAAELEHAIVVAVYHKIIGGNDGPIIVIPPIGAPTPFPGPEPGPLYANLGILRLATEVRDAGLERMGEGAAHAIRKLVLASVAGALRSA